MLYFHFSMVYFQDFYYKIFYVIIHLIYLHLCFQLFFHSRPLGGDTLLKNLTVPVMHLSLQMQGYNTKDCILRTPDAAIPLHHTT